MKTFTKILIAIIFVFWSTSAATSKTYIQHFKVVIPKNVIPGKAVKPQKTEVKPDSSKQTDKDLKEIKD